MIVERDEIYMEQFTGFTKDTLGFYKKLKGNNDKAWFEKNRKLYEDHVLAPARLFVADMGAALQKIVPDINADGRIDKSIFRIYRDVRFSKDKSPFKTNLAMWFWEGEGPRMEKPGFYFHLEPDNLMLGAGYYRFPKHIMKEFREWVADDVPGNELMQILERLSKKGDFSIGNLHYKRVPRGFDPEHKRGELLKYNGLYCGADYGIPEELFSDKLVKLCLDEYQKMLPLHEWLVKLDNRA